MVGGSGPFSSSQHGVDADDFADSGHLHSGDRLLHEGSDELLRNVWPRTASDFEVQTTAGGWVLEFASGEQWILWEDGDLELLTTDAAMIADRAQLSEVRGSVTPSPISNLAGSGLQVNGGDLEATGSGGEWTQDGTFGNSSTSSVSYTLSDQWDEVRVWIYTDSSASGTALDLRVNGVTTGYNTVTVRGSTSQDGFGKHVLTSGYAHGGLLEFSGTWADAFTAHCAKGFDPVATSPEPAAYVKCEDVAGGGALSSFEIFDDAATSFTISGMVEGRNIP